MSQPEGAAASIPAMLLRRRTERRPAFRTKRFGLWKSITWAEYARDVRAFARAMIDLGTEPGDRVALLAENRPEWLVSDLAVQAAGGVTVGVYTTSSPSQLQYLLEHSGARGLILEDAEALEKWLEIRDSLPEVAWVVVLEPDDAEFGGAGVLSYVDLLASGGAADDADPAALDARVASLRPDDTALVIYTSGTTGPPKGAMLSHANLLWACESLVGANPIREDDELLSFLPLSHIVERLITVVAPLRFGYTVSFCENLDTVMQNLREIRPTVFFAVPRIWEKIFSLVELHMKDADIVKRLAYRASLRAGGSGRTLARTMANAAVLRMLRVRLGLDRVRLAISGAAPIGPEVLAYFRTLGIDIREGYGMTESSGLIAIHQRDVRLGTVGDAFPGVEIRLLEDGEIVVRSPGVFRGYFRDEDATREAIRDGWLHTGDVGEFDDAGQLRITDRKKDIIITAGGKNVAPQKIENALKASPYVNDAVVIGDRRPYLVALLVLDEDNVAKWATRRGVAFTTYTDLAQNPEVRRLLDEEVARVNRELARVETVKRFAILAKRLYHEDGEVTATLKVKRSAIAAKYADTVEELYGARPAPGAQRAGEPLPDPVPGGASSASSGRGES